MSFLAPVFLLGLALLALPVWLHRLKVRSANRRQFSSLKLMQPASRRVHFQRRIRYWLLLALRLALLAALVLAFAQPQVHRPQTEALAEPPHYLLIDRSASMARALGSDQLSTTVRLALDQVRTGAPVGLLSVGQQLTAELAPASDGQQIITAAARLTTDFSAPDYGQVVGLLGDHLRDERGRPVPAVVHLISDFQASATPPRFAGLLPPTHIDLRLHPVADLADGNRTIAAIGAEARQLSVRVVQSGTPAPSRMEVLLNGRPLATDVTLSGSEPWDVVALPATLLPGENRISARLTGDALAADNDFFAVLVVGGAEQVPLLTRGRDDPAANYLSTALAAAGLVQQFEAQPAATFDPRTLARHRWLAITDLGALSGPLEAEFLRWMEGGGRVLAALGEGIGERSQVPLGGQLLDWQMTLAPDQAQRVGRVRRGHRLLGSATGWSDLTVTHAAPVVLAGDEEVLVELDGGQPLLWRQKVADGELLVLAGDLAREGNDLPASPAFVPWVATVAQAMSGHAALVRQRTVGEAVHLGAGLHQWVGPGGGELFGFDSSGSVRLREPGFYEVYDQEARMTTLAANVDRRESDLAPMAAEQLDAWRAAVSNRVPGDEGTATSGDTSAQSFHLPLLLALALLMLIETLFANRYLPVQSGMKLPGHIDALVLRLRRQRWLRGLAVWLPVAAIVSAAAGHWLVRSGFDPGVALLARVMGLAALTLLGYFLLWRPLKHLREAPAEAVEASTSVFNGRIETWATTPADNPLRPLLGADAAAIAQRHPAAEIVPASRLALPAMLAAAGGAGLLLVIFAGPGLLGHGARHLWAGWLLPGLRPAQQIVVQPGDEVVQRGGKLSVSATMQGFAPAQATVHARTADGEWRSAAMAKNAADHTFTFIAIREPVSYYVSAAGVRSPEYEIEVVDLPAVVSAVMTLHFPAWTGLAPRAQTGLGDVRAIAGTRVELELETESPLAAGQLVVNGLKQPLTVSGSRLRGELVVDGDGQFHIAAAVAGGSVRLTPDYLLSEQPDQAPLARFTRPGRDVGASAVEEVKLAVSSRDDFALTSLELRYAVNGGAWQSVPFDTGLAEVEADHVLMLEDLGQAGFLQPGDVISYYAAAGDRNGEQHSDMFFIDVQPFDRRVRQSQMAAGGNGGQGQENEISQRQKEIILSTWNLKRERERQSRDPDRISNSIQLVAQLQATLADQATTLADRARARELGSDESIARFIEHLDLAVEAMQPAIAQLENEALEAALPPEQQALQHLKRAEAAFTDIQVSFSSNRSSGGQRGRDLAEMLELEMDLEKNQYETGSQASADAPEQAQDDALAELEQLARRQERLAQQAGSGQQAPAQRWQQEALRREAERLREQLERQSRARQAGQNGQAGQRSGSSQQAADGGESELQERLNEAIGAMDEAAEAMADGSDPAALESAAKKAQSRLEAAHRAAQLDRQRSMTESFSELAANARELHRSQARLARDLEQAVDEAVASSAEESGLDPELEQALAGRKRNLQQALQQLDQNIRQAAQQFEEGAPRAASALRSAAGELEQSEAVQRLGVAAEYIDYGAAIYIVSSEGLVTEALRELADATGRASELATARDLRSGEELGQALAQLRDLRTSLDQVAAAGGGPRPGQAGAVSARGGAAGDQPASGAFFDPRQQISRTLGEPAVSRALERDVEAAGSRLRQALPDLRSQGISEQTVAEVRELLEQMDLSQFSGNPALIGAEFERLHLLVQQLEVAIGSALTTGAPTLTTARTPVPADFQAAVAEYYRRLSEGQSTTGGEY